LRNLAKNPRYASRLRELENQIATMLAAEGLTPGKDNMPLDLGIKTELPDQNIR